MLINDSNIHPSIPLIEYISTLPVMPTKLKILHLEDFATDAELIRNVLKKEQLEFEILVVDTKEKFIDALQDFSPDIILADHSLPSFDSYDALAILVETGICVPFILVTAAMSDEFAVDIIKKGADDYIIKDRLKRLPVAIYNSLEKFRLEKERKAFIDKLVEKEKRYHALVENSADAVFILNAKGKITYVSSSARQVLGYSEEEVMEMDWFTIAHFDDVAEMADVMQQALNTPGTPAKGHLSRWLHKNGSWPWIEATVTNMLADPAINGIVANFRDVTERKIAEKKIVHLNRLYAFLSQINQTIVHSPDQETVFKQACRIACDTGKFRVAWIGVFDKKNQTISLVEGCGLKPNHLTELSKVFYERGGPQDTVLSTGNYYICDNIKNNREINKWKTFAAGNRFGSFIILPLKKSGRIFGTLNLYACDSEFFNSEEIELLTEATKDISFALDVFEKEKLKLQADEKVKHRELRLNQAQAIAHLGSWEVDFVSGILTWSEEALRIHGLPQQEVEQTYDSWLSFIHPDDLDRVLQVSKEARLAVSNYSFYHRIIRKDGIVRSVFSEAHFEFDSTGKLKGLYGVTHDITEMKKAEDALRVSELNLRTIFNSTSEAFMLCDNNGIVKTFNNKLKDQTFLNSEKEIKIGDSIFDFVAETRKHNFGDAFIKALAGESLQYDYSSKRKSGKTDWFSFTVNPVYNSEKIEGISITSRDITSRKKDEQKMIATSKELKRAVTDLKQIMDWSLDVICTINGDGFFVSVSAASKIVWGFAPEELVGKPFIDFVVKEDINSTVEAAEDIVNGRLVPIFENRYLHKNGRVVPILWSVNWDEKNRLMFCVAKDITEMKEVGKQLRKSESNLLAIFENTSEGFILADENGFLKLYNSKAEKFVGLNIGKEISVGRSIYEFIEESRKENFKSLISKVLAGETIAYDHFYDRKDGQKKWFNFRITPVSSAGEIKGICITAGDITERKQMEDSLKKSEFRYRQIVETAQEGMWVIDQNNKTVFVNKKMCEIVGYSKEEMKGKPNYFLKDDEEGKEAALRQIERRKRGINEIYESQFLTKSGRNIWTTVATNPIYDEDGAYKGTLAMITDITTRKEQELQIRKNAEERELLIRKLTNSIKDLQQFTYITSHNFTAPLSNLIALLSLFDYSNLNEDNREVVEMFKTSTNQLNKTINDIVQILIIKDNANVSITHNKISTLLNNVYEALAYEINETGCTISSNLEVEEILFNKSYLESILINLISNAIKYRAPGRPMQIHVFTGLDDTGKVFLAITDNGIGIDLNMHGAKIFGLYQRFHSNTNGEGLGLFIVKSQITSLGGSIKVESELGKGTTFTIMFSEEPAHSTAF